MSRRRKMFHRSREIGFIHANKRRTGRSFVLARARNENACRNGGVVVVLVGDRAVDERKLARRNEMLLHQSERFIMPRLVRARSLSYAFIAASRCRKVRDA